MYIILCIYSTLEYNQRKYDKRSFELRCFKFVFKGDATMNEIQSIEDEGNKFWHDPHENKHSDHVSLGA